MSAYTAPGGATRALVFSFRLARRYERFFSLAHDAMSELRRCNGEHPQTLYLLGLRASQRTQLKHSTQHTGRRVNYYSPPGYHIYHPRRSALGLVSTRPASQQCGACSRERRRSTSRSATALNNYSSVNPHLLLRFKTQAC